MTMNNNNMELNDEQMNGVAGGQKIQPMKISCAFCGKSFYANILNNEIKCKYCGKNNKFAG